MDCLCSDDCSWPWWCQVCPLICSWCVSNSFAKLLCDLEKPLAYFSRLLFENVGLTPLYEAVLDRRDVWLDSLLEPSSELVIENKLFLTLWIQLDNCTKDNENMFVFVSYKRHFQWCVYIISFGRPHIWWYECIFWIVEHEVAWGFSNNLTLDEVVHRFGQHSSHLTYDWGFTCVMTIFLPCNTSCCTWHKIGAHHRVFLFSALTKRVRRCYQMWSPILANQYPWRMWRVL